ncbi:peptidoglycan recognition family protein, partial [Clostridium sp. LS]|uniref:peptidoglycan recognition protein family protein n=1 Tax=Clostridium sp. LS TaxID=1352601 RepID=UPI000C1A483F
PQWTVEAIHHMHQTEPQFMFAGIGYHYYIRLDGSVYKGRPDNAIGAHCQGCNTNTLGIAFEGNYDNRTEMPDAQFNAWCELKSYLYNKYGNMPVYGHREKGSSECPGANFPLEKVRNANVSPSRVIGWNKDNTGWWYCTDVVNNYFYKDSWELIDGVWYSFDKDGYARGNTWIQDGGKWYYLRENCMMAKSQWLWIDGECYCFDEHGGL